MPSVKWWRGHFYGCAVSSTLNTNVTLMVSKIRSSYLCQVPLVTLTPEALSRVVCGINPMLCHSLQPYCNLITGHLNFQCSEPPHKPQGTGVAPDKSINGLGNWLVLLGLWNKHCCYFTRNGHFLSHLRFLSKQRTNYGEYLKQRNHDILKMSRDQEA